MRTEWLIKLILVLPPDPVDRPIAIPVTAIRLAAKIQLAAQVLHRVEEFGIQFMAALGNARLFSATVVIVAVLAWVTGTNHCLLGLMKQPGNFAVACSHCPDHCRNAAPSAMLGCCQGLQSLKPDLAKPKITFIPVLLATLLFAVDPSIPPEGPKTILPKTEYDIGPPAVSSFAGSVLKRSLREHAPPLLS